MSTAALVMLIIGIIIFVVGVTSFIVVLFYKKSKIKKSEVAITNKVEESTSDLAKLFGSKSNIESITTTGSRVSVNLKDITLVDTNKIREIYNDVLFTNSKAVFIVGEKSKEFANQLENKLK